MGSTDPQETPAVLVDAHAHLDMYDSDVVDVVLADLERSGILTLSNSVDPESFEATLALSARAKGVVPGFGVHPWEAHRFADDLEALSPFLERAPFVGEIGLDHRWVEDEDRYPAQAAVFEFQLEAARRLGKLVNVHTSGAERASRRLIEASGVDRVIIHWYSGPDDELREMIDRGYYFTVGVEVALSERIRDIAAMIPPDQILTETDNPGGLEWLIGEPGTPSALEPVVVELAALHGLGPKEIVDQVEANTRALFDGDRNLRGWVGPAAR